MSFGLDGSFSKHDAEEEKKNLNALLIGLVSLPLIPLVALGVFSAASQMGMISEHDHNDHSSNNVQEAIYTAEAATSASSKFIKIDLEDPVITIAKEVKTNSVVVSKVAPKPALF